MNGTAKRFRVAFSYAGEKRDFVAQVAAILAAALREKIDIPLTPAFAKDQEQWMEKVKGALAVDESASAIVIGLVMKLDDIIEMACSNPFSS
jgi:hypothetical protein